MQPCRHSAIWQRRVISTSSLLWPHAWKMDKVLLGMQRDKQFLILPGWLMHLIPLIAKILDDNWQIKCAISKILGDLSKRANQRTINAVIIFPKDGNGT